MEDSAVKGKKKKKKRLYEVFNKATTNEPAGSIIDSKYIVKKKKQNEGGEFQASNVKDIDRIERSSISRNENEKQNPPILFPSVLLEIETRGDASHMKRIEQRHTITC